MNIRNSLSTQRTFLGNYIYEQIQLYFLESILVPLSLSSKPSPPLQPLKAFPNVQNDVIHLQMEANKEETIIQMFMLPLLMYLHLSHLWSHQIEHLLQGPLIPNLLHLPTQEQTELPLNLKNWPEPSC